MSREKEDIKWLWNVLHMALKGYQGEIFSYFTHFIDSKPSPKLKSKILGGNLHQYLKIELRIN